jgi:DNA-binding response OmpR family regulator
MRVLVIDDEKNLADTLVWILQSAGFEATGVYDGASALRRLEEFQPEIVISDVIMPGMNGIEVCAEIQTRFPDCRILLFSGQTASNDLLRVAHGQGFTWELLAKPMDPEELLAKLASLSHQSDSAGA